MSRGSAGGIKGVSEDQQEDQERQQEQQEEQQEDQPRRSRGASKEQQKSPEVSDCSPVNRERELDLDCTCKFLVIQRAAELRTRNRG